MVDTETERETTESYDAAMYVVFELFTTGAFHTDMILEKEKLVFCAIVFLGLIIFAVLIGFITDSVGQFIDELTAGRGKVFESGHTLILGWNESTVRIVCQIAFLRRQWQMQNEGILKRLMPWTRVPASTPVAERPVVILADNFEEKLEMDEILRAGLLARGIVPARTCVGWDVICRNGNPTDIHDLIRVRICATTTYQQ